MNNVSEKQLKKYYRVIWKELPCQRAEKQRIISSLKESVKLYLSTNVSLTIDDIYKHFGTVDEIVAAYIDDNNYTIQKRFSGKKIIVIILIAIFICLVSCIITLIYIRDNNAIQAIIETEIK